MLAQIGKSWPVIFIISVVFVVYLFSSYDVCWFTVPGKNVDKGFVFGNGWTEHLHSSENGRFSIRLMLYTTGGFG